MIHSLVEYRDVLDKAGLLCKDTSAGSGDSPVTGLTYESKKAETGTLFVCKGAAFKKEYLLEAAERGSIVYVSETDYGISLPMLQVSDIRAAMPYLARLFYRTWADEEMNLMGITGTKGKTTAVGKQEYTGEYVTPEIDVLVKQGKTWVKTDPANYTVTYINNINKGKATILVTGKGTAAAGSKTAKFTIKAKNMSKFNK